MPTISSQATVKFAQLVSFIRRQSKNYQVLLAYGTVDSFLTKLVEDFNDLYTVALGATRFQLSMVRAASSAVSTFISVPAGWLSDAYSLRKIMIIGMMIQVLSIAFYAFAQNWNWIIVAMLLATVTMTLVFRNANIFVANSLADRDRAKGYGIRMTIIQFFSIFAPTIGGIIVFYLGGIRVENIRPLYFIQIAGFSIISVFLSFKLKDMSTSEGTHMRDFFRDYKEMFKAGDGLKRFAFINATQAITVMMRSPFHFVYAVEFKGADSLIIGYMGTCLVLFSMLLAIPMGSLADRQGRKFGIFFIRPFFYGSLLLLVFAPKGASWVLLLAWCMRGAFVSSHAWETMLIEMVPKEYRGRWTGFSSLFQNLVGVPAMLLGGYLYDIVDPTLVFLIPIAVDALVTMPVLATIPDTLRHRPLIAK